MVRRGLVAVGCTAGASLVPRMGDSLAPARVVPLLTGAFGRPYLYALECASTQRALDPSLPEGAVAVCEVQTAGRGRLGRTWDAAARSSILCSILLRPPRERRPAELSLVGGLAVAEVVERASGLPAQIKWPNDVLLRGQKVAGVLAEASSEAVVLGIGINVNQPADKLPASTRLPAVSLLALDARQRNRAALLADLLGCLERDYRIWRDNGLGPLHARLEARDLLRGREVTLEGERGVGVGIDPRGRFEIAIAGEHRFVESGEVSLEP